MYLKSIESIKLNENNTKIFYKKSFYFIKEKIINLNISLNLNKKKRNININNNNNFDDNSEIRNNLHLNYYNFNN
jgi:hypothetical protein